MITVFERIPDVFVHAYDDQLQAWGREFRRRGPRCPIIFRRAPGSPVILDETGRPIMAGAWLTADIEPSVNGPRMVVRPADDLAEELIAEHVRAMRGFMMQ